MNGGGSLIIMMALMVGMMFFSMRGQKKQQQARLEMLKKMAQGDKVVTIGGLYGVVDSIDREVNTVTLDVDGIYLTFELAAIKTVVSSAATGAVTVEDLAPAETQEASAIEE